MSSSHRMHNSGLHESPLQAIVVGDLLHKQGAKDKIEIASFQINESTQILGGNVAIQSVSTNELVVQLIDIAYHQGCVCDFCGTVYDQHYSLANEMVEYKLRVDDEDPLEVGNSVYRINDDMTIDVLDLIRTAILLNNPVQHICPICTTKTPNDTGSEDSLSGGFSGSVQFVGTP